MCVGTAFPAPAQRDADAPCLLPPIVSDRVGRAQIFAHRIKDKSILAGRRDVVWGDGPDPTPGTYGMRYMPGDRDADRRIDLDWYLRNRPDWVVRKCDGAPAFEFNAPSVPVDIRNPDVREYLFRQSAAPAIEKRFAAIAVDNISANNIWQRCTVQGKEGSSRIYAGSRVDSVYAADVADWLGWLADRLHRSGTCVAANHYYGGTDRAGYLKIASKLDIVVDEHGMTRKCKPMDLDGKWLDRISLNREIARTKALVVIDQVCPTRAPITPEALDWSLANYMLIKGDRTYLAIIDSASYDGSYVDTPELYLKTGRPLAEMAERGGVHHRLFENALALVNASSRETKTFEVDDPQVWRMWRSGAAVERRLTLAPGTALTLVRGTAEPARSITP